MKHRVTILSSSALAKRDIKRHAASVIITSPYLTSPTAEDVIGRCDPQTAVVLTTFDARTFATGGSSLSTIRKLMVKGYSVHALDGLHAKIVLTEGAALIGSQNLTRAGTLNLEATVRTSDLIVVRQLRDNLSSWLQRSTEINQAMVDNMEQAVERLRQAADEFKAACDKVDRKVRAMRGVEA